MTTRRLYIKDLQTGMLQLSAVARHYLHDVLRMNTKDTLEVFDGVKHRALATIVSLDEGGASIRVGELEEVSQRARVDVFCAAPKGERADWLVEKLAEIGVASLQWLVCERSVVIPKEESNKMRRWERIATEATRQSGQVHTLEVKAPLALQELGPAREPQAYFGSPEGQPAGSYRWDERPAQLIIGPEGGLTQVEQALLVKLGYHPLQLGTSVLRVETAAVVGASIVMEHIRGANE